MYDKWGVLKDYRIKFVLNVLLKILKKLTTIEGWIGIDNAMRPFSKITSAGLSVTIFFQFNGPSEHFLNWTKEIFTIF